MRVLVACEFSGVVREAFRQRGHDAWSCDLLPPEVPGPHFEGDVLPHLDKGWDLLIGHPPCTHLAVSGAKWFKEKIADGRQRTGLEFFLALLNAPIPMICLENPVSIAATYIKPPTQVIHPWQFGHAEEKTTCLWLKNLPPLKPTKILRGKHRNNLYYLPPSEDRWAQRSKTFPGIAEAMATQWSKPFKIGFGMAGPSRLLK